MANTSPGYINDWQASSLKSTRTRYLIPSYTEILAVAILLMVYLVVYALIGYANPSNVNIVGPFVLVAILGCANWKMARKNGKNFWTALFWFRLSISVYYGLGTMFVYVVNDVTLNFMKEFYAFNDHEVLKLNMLVAVTVILVLMMARFAILQSGGYAARMHRMVSKNEKRPDNSLFVSGFFILGLGLTISYIFVTPYRMGWTNYVLPGVVISLTKLIPVGFFLIVLWARRNARKMLPIVFVFVAMEMLTNLLFFSKSSLLLLLVMISLAFLWDRVSIMRVLGIGVLVASTYFTINPMVNFARHEIGLRYGANVHASFTERLEIISGYFADSGIAYAATERQGGLSRLSYVNAATFLIHRYDSGRSDDWPERLGAVLVPRFLWPQKPIITDIGPRIYTLGTGNTGSSSGAGLFAEAYWAWGWWGVLLFMSIYGAAVGVLTTFASNIMHTGQWLYFPVVLMSLRYGMRTDGHYISDAAGALVILVSFYAVLRFVDKLLKFFRI